MSQIHFTTGNSILDVILSAGGTGVSFYGAAAASSSDIALWQKELAWVVAVLAGLFTIVNLAHLIYTRVKKSKRSKHG